VVAARRRIRQRLVHAFAALFGSRAFAFGATIALRRPVLESIGGFAAIADQLADDYRLGELTRARGLVTRLSEVVVDTWMHERTLGSLLHHELRWLRTIRAVRPLGYALSFVTFPLPVALIGWALAGGAAATTWMLIAAVAARLMLHLAICGAGSPAAQLWVIPLNDALAFALWCWGFASRRVLWRDTRYRVARDGSVEPTG